VIEAAARLERAAQMLRERPVPVRHAAIIELLTEAIFDIAQTSPSDQAHKVEIIARVMRD
jgi:hypothetical protein